MAVEVVESNLPILENGSEANVSVDNGSVNIKFGTHGAEEPVKAEVNKVAESNLPKDAVDEWPEPTQIHSFYIARYRAFEDQNLKAKMDLIDKDLTKKSQARSLMIEKIRAKRADRAQIITQIRALSVENKQFRSIMDEKRKEMEPLQQALGKLRGSSGGGRDGRERGSIGICSSEQELNDVIKSLQYRIQHESIPLSEEKQILREIKQLEGTRAQVIAYAAERARIQDSMGEKETIQGQVKSIGVDLDGVRKEKQAVHARLKQFDEEKLAIEKEIAALEAELDEVKDKKDKAWETKIDMRKKRDEGNSPFQQYRLLLTKAKNLAANKDVEGLKELTETEGEKFMAQWNSDKAFRADYERRILPSLDIRQLSRDGRLRNPGEKPLVQAESSTTTSEAEAVKPIAKKQAPKEVVVPAVVPTQDEEKVEKTKGGKNNKEGNKKKEEKIDADEEEYFSHEILQVNPPAKKEQVDEKKLKELKREEEIFKRNQAEERKKKLAEKAAAKAAIKAQKEAEKKLKDREKKLRKKSGATITAADSEEADEPIEEVAEAEKIEEEIENPVPQKKNKERKENTIRARGRARGQDSLPKAILKRKKGTNYWVWAAPAAAVVILVLMLVGYSYLS